MSIDIPADSLVCRPCRQDVTRVIADAGYIHGEKRVERVQTVTTLLKGCNCMIGCKNRICGWRKNGRNCSEGCQCTNCENHALPSQDRQDLADVALEETVHNSMELEEEFAEFVFAAAFDVDDVNTELLDIDE